MCVAWHERSGLPTGVSVVPIARNPAPVLALAARTAHEVSDGQFVLGVGSGSVTERPIAAVRGYIDELRRTAKDVPIYVGALGPQMLALAGRHADGAALNWCTPAQVAWSRERVAEGARRAGRDPRSVAIHEYIRVCVDTDETAARLAFAKMVMTYALARPDADRTKGYRGHFARMGFGAVLDDLESRREAGASDDDLAARFPDKFMRRVGYWGRPEGARAAFQKLAAGLDIAIVRLVPARQNDLAAARLAMTACAPRD